MRPVLAIGDSLRIEADIDQPIAPQPLDDGAELVLIFSLRDPSQPEAQRAMDDADFLARAPEEVVAEIRQRLTDEKSRLQLLADALATLGVVK